MSQQQTGGRYQPRSMEFKAAVRQAVKAKIGLMGISGSGKTWGALMIARGLVGPQGKILVINTETNGAKFYAPNPAINDPGLTEFDIFDFRPPYEVRDLVYCLRKAAQEGYGAVVVDSWSHFWEGTGGILDFKSDLDASDRKKSFANWKQGNVPYNLMIRAIMDAPLHVLLTMRSKMGYEQTGGEVRRVGLEPVMRDSAIYELDIVIEISGDHVAVTTKDRTRTLDSHLKELTTGHGEVIEHHLSSGEPFSREDTPALPAPTPTPPPTPPAQPAPKPAATQQQAPKQQAEPQAQAASPPKPPLAQAQQQIATAGQAQPLPVGQTFRARLSRGELKQTDHGPAYCWMIQDVINPLAYGWGWCWHKNSPCEATDSDHPETYRGEVLLELSEQPSGKIDPNTGKPEDKHYYRVEAIAHV